MDMPTPCPECGEIVEFESMMPVGKKLYCKDCSEELEQEEI